MSERQGFLKSIIANPADETCRLVFADWLDENGETERAELIRVQCQLARRAELKPVERERLRDREKELMTAHGKAWAGTALPDFAARFAPPVWDRGFVKAAAVLHHDRSAALRLFAEHPVESLCYVVPGDQVWAVATFQPLGRVHTLVVDTSGLDDRQAAGFARGRRFRSLVSLTFVTAGVVPAECQDVLRVRFGDRVNFRRRRRN